MVRWATLDGERAEVKEGEIMVVVVDEAWAALGEGESMRAGPVYAPRSATLIVFGGLYHAGGST